jgi:DNA-binding MarR family transcriptional regulator
MEDAAIYERVDRLNLILPQIVRRIQTVPIQAPPAPALSLPQVRVLLLLEMEGDLTMGELARCSSVTMPTATSCINGLVAGRYVARRHSPRDRRVVLVSLTAKGRKVLATLHEERRQRLRTIFGRLTPEDQVRLVEAFEAILEILRKMDEAGPVHGSQSAK